MKDYKHIARYIILLVIVIAAFIFALKLIKGAFALIGGIFNTILGIAVIVALIAIVIWMFSYARRNR